jgi:parallel beta-helix repeat protein
MNRRAFSVTGILVVVLALLALAMPLAVAGQENILRVGPGQEYATIQAAVDAARQGSRIFVYPGIYHERVLVNKNNLQIIAQGKPVVVRPPGPPAGFTVLADHVTIQGFDIGFGEGCATSIWFNGSHNTFADNFIHQVADCLGVNALVCRDYDGGSDFNTIERNHIVHSDLGIVVQATTDGALNQGNVIRDNRIDLVYTTPIAIANGTGFVVSGNTITSGEYCILVGTLLQNPIAQGHHAIVDNSLSGCGLNAISVYADSGTVVTHNRIAGNTVTGCTGSCIDLTAYEGSTLTNNEIKANTISDSMALRGIRVSAGADDNRILDNEVREAARIGITVAGNSNLIAGNAAQGNTILDLQDLGQGNKWPNNTYDTANW